MGRVRKGVYLDETLIEDCDKMLDVADARSRNEFIEKALKFYLGYLKPIRQKIISCNRYRP